MQYYHSLLQYYFYNFIKHRFNSNVVFTPIVPKSFIWCPKRKDCPLALYCLRLRLVRNLLQMFSIDCLKPAGVRMFWPPPPIRKSPFSLIFQCMDERYTEGFHMHINNIVCHILFRKSVSLHSKRTYPWDPNGMALVWSAPRSRLFVGRIDKKKWLKYVSLSPIFTLTTLLRSFTSTYSITTNSNLSGVYYIYNRDTDAGCVSIFARLRVIVTQHKV